MASSSSTNAFRTTARNQVDDNFDDTMTTLPPLLASSTLNPSETAYARSWYGAEISSEGRKLADLLKERIPAEDYQRWWQANQFVCSGKAQNDFPAAFQRRWKNWQVNVEERRGVWDKEPEGGLQNLLVTRKTGIRDALRRAVDLAVDIRVLQSLRDGNHRTALLSLILALAESDVVLRPTFPIIKAYAVLSARHHEGNADNALDTDAIAHVRHRLFQILRHAVAPGTATWEYIDARANEIRELPVVLSRVESMYRGLQLRTSTAGRGEGKCSDREDQQWAWKMLPESDRRLIKLIHPTITEQVYSDVIIKHY